MHYPVAAVKLINQFSGEMARDIDERYRVYCLGPDPQNSLVWSHYADSHRGICLEFSLSNEIFCAALKCEYSSAYPIMKLHDNSDDTALLSLLAKSDVWSYEKEYRLIAQEESKALPDSESLKSNGHFLEFPQGALVSVITGCQSDHQRIHDLVKSIDPAVGVKQACRVPNRFEISISP